MACHSGYLLICYRFRMKRLCNCKMILLFVVTFCFGSLFFVYKTVKYKAKYEHSTDSQLPSVIQTQYILKHNRTNCIDDKHVQDLINLLQHDLMSSERKHLNFDIDSSLGDNQWTLTTRDVIRRFARIRPQMTMKSDSNSTKIEHGYGTGVTKECLSRDYGDLRDWPKASIIIPFCENELLIDILHTVHSVVQRSPDELLEEVILIDDNTTKADFKELLDNYCSAVFGDKVRIVRTNQTIGLIKARLLGARLARGDVIIPLDAHMEVQDTWLQALLYELLLNNKTLATSMLDWMRPLRKNEWSYQMGANSFMCVFTWDLGFGFGYPRPEILDKQKNHPMKAFPAPCSVGASWAIYKDFFMEVGAVDEGMERWGAENLDLPIRVWLFGGQVVQVPCSHAAHMERPHQRDYRFGWDKFINRNYKRVVEVWFDDYKKHVYRKKPELKKIDVGNLTERFEVKKRAKHTFDWFLRNIYPELGLYDNASFGYDWLRNTGMNKCLHSTGIEFIMWECLGQPQKEGVWLTSEGHMRSDLQYWQVQGKDMKSYKLGPEGATGYYQAAWISKWVHWQGGPMMVYRNGLGVNENICLEAYDTEKKGSLLRLSTCDPSNKYQRWEWKEYTSDYRLFMERKDKSPFNSDYHKTVLEVMSDGRWS